MKPRRLPSLHSLRAFEAAGRHLSFARAADELSVSPTAISHQIRNLEAWLGHKLFRRSTRAVALTEIGRDYLPRVEAAFDELAGATAEIGRRPERDVVTVTTTTTFTTKWLIPRLARFQTLHPGIDVRITTSLELVDLAREGIDLAVRFGQGKWPGLEAHRMMREQIFPVCAPGLGPLREPADLAAHTLLHAASLSDEWRLWLTAAGVPDLVPAREQTFDQQVAVLQAAIDGLGVAMGHSHIVEEDLAAGRLAAPFDVQMSGTFSYYVVHRPEASERDAVRTFRDWLLQMGSDT